MRRPLRDRSGRIADLPDSDEIRRRARERSRESVRDSRERLVASARPIAHTAVAAALAWLAATELLGHQSPFVLRSRRRSRWG